LEAARTLDQLQGAYQAVHAHLRQLRRRQPLLHHHCLIFLHTQP
jgi:hypothetical protein